ncbi:MAG: GAF domain-containing protein [Burkholderiaceae bacterium]|nr:GAF domain-containing protein [Burkholderiaceae bacterium]
MSPPADAFDDFRAVFEADPDGVLVVNAQGRVVLANGAASDLLGYSREALQDLTVEDLVPANAAPRHAALRHAYAHAPKSRPMGTDLDLSARRADGSEVMVEIALSPLHSFGHDYVVASLRGIGAYPRVKRALQRARYNEFAVRLGRVAVDTLDPDELLQRMPAAVQEALEVDAVAVFLLTPGRLELRVASSSGVPAALASGTVYANRPDTLLGYVVAQRAPLIVADLACEQRFAAPAWLLESGAKSCIAVPLIDRGHIIGVLGAWSRQQRKFGDDELAFLESLASLLSTSLQRAQAESQLRHSQRLETVGQLTGGVAHDFNNLLTVILGNLQLLADQPECETHPLSRQLVAAAARAGQRGAELTGKLLAFSRRQSLAPEPVDPVAMLQSLADMLRRSLGENIRVVAQTPAHCAHCLADALQLESALLNVAVNARDAMPKGGTLMLRCGVGAAPETEIDGPQSVPSALDGQPAAPQAPPWVWLSLHDDGVGMTPEVLDRAFEPFFTTKEAGRGTGLGLSTVYGFVKQSHGHIAIDSAPGAGTTVTLYFPAIDEPAAADAAAPAGATRQAPLCAGLRVLLVEDDDDVRRVAQSFLRSLGCEAVACSDAGAALAELAQGQPFELLFSDIRLGAGIDGHELAQRALALQPGIAVLLSSGYSRHLEGGRDGQPLPWPMLKKPYDREALARAIAAALPARRA